MTFSFERLFFTFFFSLFIISSAQSKTQPTNPYTYQYPPLSSAVIDTHFQPPFCPKTSNKDENSAQKYTKVIQLYKASFKDPTDPESIWDQGYLKQNPHILEILHDFKQERRAQTLKHVNLEGKTVQELHKELLNLGFFWSKNPLRASFKKQTYWLKNGKTTKDHNHEDIVYTHFYVHADGSLVHLKAAGIPDLRAKNPRRAVHAAKAVLLNMDSNLCKKNNCHYDTSYQNEAFKVTNNNQPVPKAPRPKFGLKLPKTTGNFVMDRQKIRVIKNTVMNLAHTNLKTDCPLPH